MARATKPQVLGVSPNGVLCGKIGKKVRLMTQRIEMQQQKTV
jgi:hypothetical protein